MFQDNSSLTESNKPIDMNHFTKSFTMDVTCSCAYGINPDSLNNPDHPFVMNVKKILNMNVNFGQVLSMLAPMVARLFNFELFDSSAIEFFARQAEYILLQSKNSRDDGKLSVLYLEQIIF